MHALCSVALALCFQLIINCWNCIQNAFIYIIHHLRGGSFHSASLSPLHSIYVYALLRAALLLLEWRFVFALLIRRMYAFCTVSYNFFCSVCFLFCFFFLILNSASVILVIIVLYKVKPSIMGTKYQNVTTIFSSIVVVVIFDWYILWIDVHLDV